MSTSSSGVSTGSGPTLIDYGLISGLNTSAIIQAELTGYQAPITALQTQQSKLATNVADYQQVNTDLISLKGLSDTLAQSSGWTARTATSTNAAVTATATAGTPTGSVQFNVLQLAAANSLVSSGTVSSTSQVVTSAGSMLLSVGGGQLGFSTLSSASGVALGSHTVAVTQSSQAASLAGTTVLNGGTSNVNITSGSNDTISLTADGTAYNLTLAASPTGGYTSSQLLSAVNSAISAAGASGAVQAGYDSAGHLVFSTLNQGSSQSLSITGGSALATLGLAAGSSTGVDGIVSVDGVSNTLSTVTAGSTVTLNGTSGETINATLSPQSSQQYADSSLLQAGSVTAQQVSLGSGSLSDIVSAVNAAGTGIVASAVQTGTNQYVLQLSSSSTGTNGNLSIDQTLFSGSALGNLKTAVAGQNAQIQIGGSAGYTISSQNDSFSGLLPGLTVNVTGTTSSPVTVTVASDSSSIADSVSGLVDQANAVLADLNQYAGYNSTTKTGGPLMGSAALSGLQQQLLAAFASGAGVSSLATSANAGIKIDNGKLTFNKDAFLAAYNANPTQVQSLFTQGGTFTPLSSADAGKVKFSYASTATRQGTYDVQVSQSAQQAQANGAVLASGSVGAAENLTITMGGATASYSTSAGQSLASVASGLNSSFAAQGISLTAQVVNGNQLQLLSAGFGSAQSFTVASDSTASGTLGLTGGSSSATYAGVDVAGTINGVAATGTGQFLAAPTTDKTLGGLSVQVTAAGITSNTDLGSISYTPGLAQLLSNISAQYADPTSGSISQTIKGLQNQSRSLNPQISMYQAMYTQQQRSLTNQFAALEATLGNLKNQSSSLASQLSGLSSNKA
jgi:flagellar hook-associated protein 2